MHRVAHCAAAALTHGLPARTVLAHTRSRGFTALLLVTFVTGCFRYVPTELAAVPDGRDVRVYLTRQGLAALDELPLESGPVVRGRLMHQYNGDVTLRVPVAMRQTGFHLNSIGQDVLIPTSDIVQIERRELDKFGTVLLIGGAAAVTAFIMTLILDSHSETVIDPPPTEEIRVPFFTLRFR
jgi:hypothetical protein